MEIQLIAALGLVLLLIIILAKTAVVVPQQSAYVVERLGQVQRHARAPASTCSSRSWT